MALNILGFFCWALLCVLHVYRCQGARILLLPAPMYSHCMELSSIGTALVDRGHNVSILLGTSFNHKKCYKETDNETNQISVVLFQDDPNFHPIEEGSKALTAKLMNGEEFSYRGLLDIITNNSRSICSNKLLDKKGFLKLEQYHFDLVIVDGIFPLYCYYLIPYKLGVPYVSSSTFFEDFVSGRPFLPGVYPSTHSQSTGTRFTFSEKLSEALVDIFIHILAMYVIPMDIVSQFTPDINRWDIVNLASQSQLFLYNTDVVLGFPFPQMPNHVYIGGITTKPAKPLSGEIRTFYERSTEGVVLVTFGSTFDSLPPAIESKLHNAFIRLSCDILWKYSVTGQEKNVLRVQWIPQNDVLGNVKTKLFISHCGNNGVFEALYHGVPILCLPLFGDQFYNAVRVQEWKVGEVISLLFGTEDEIFSAITNILRNSTYRRNMERASAIYHSRPFSPRERAVFSIENVLKFGGDHLRSRGSYMSTFTYLGFDIVCFVLAILLTLVIFVYKSITLLCRCCCKGKLEKLKRQ